MVIPGINTNLLYMINMNYHSRELVKATVYTFSNIATLLCVPTLIRIRNVIRIKKNGVVSFFKEIRLKSYIVSLEIILKKGEVMWFFRELFFKKWKYVVIPGKC